MYKQGKKNIKVIFEDLGNVYGYLQGLHGEARLHINCKLDTNTKDMLIEIGKAAVQRGELFLWLKIQ